MPTFTNAPPDDGGQRPLQLIRVPSQSKIRWLITTPDLIGTPTHYYHGRTQPCEGPECQACQEGLSWRWHGYVAIYSPRSQRHCLLELTARVAESFVRYRDDHGTLRGCDMTAWRSPQQPNGKVFVTLVPADLTSIKLPEPPDVLRCLMKMWDLAEADVSIGPATKNAPRIAIDTSTSPKNWQPNRLPDANLYPTKPPSNGPTKTA